MDKTLKIKNFSDSVLGGLTGAMLTGLMQFAFAPLQGSDFSTLFSVL